MTGARVLSELQPRLTDQQDGEGGERALEAYSAFKAQLRVVADAIPGHVWYATPLGALVFINSRSADYLQLPKDHPLRFGIDVGGDWDAHIPLLHPDDHEETRRVWSTCLHTGTAGEVSFRLRDPEGNYRWFLSLAAPLRADDGTLVCWVGVNFDIEDRKRAEDKIREQEADVRQILDFSPQMIAVFGSQRERLYVNRIALDYFGLTLDEWRAAAPGAVSHPDDTKRVKTKWDSGMSSGAALKLGIPDSTLETKIQRLGIGSMSSNSATRRPSR